MPERKLSIFHLFIIISKKKHDEIRIKNHWCLKIISKKILSRFERYKSNAVLMNYGSVFLTKNKPLLMLDGWRGLAVLWVVMFHAISPFIHTTGNHTYADNLLYKISSIGGIGVVLFFVISGYCITGAMFNSLLKENGIKDYIANRIRRIYPPYLMALVLYAISIYLIEIIKKNHIVSSVNHGFSLNLDCFFWISNLLLIQHEFNQLEIVPVAWSLCYEIAFYGVLGLILAALCVMRKFSVSIKACQDSFSLTVFFVTLLSIVWLSFSPASCPFPFQLWYQFGIGAIFYMASLPAQKHHNGWKYWVFNYKSHLAILLFSIALFGLVHKKVFHQMTVEHKSIDGHAADPCQPVVTIIFILILYSTKSFDAKIASNFLFRKFMRLGVISYSIYLLHTLIQPFIDAGLRKLGLDHDWYFPNYLLQIVIPISLSIPFYTLIEKRCLSQKRLQITEKENSLISTSP